MGYIYIQSSYNQEATIGFSSSNESLNQSIVFGRNFQLNSATIRTALITPDLMKDIKFRIEVRSAKRSCHFLDMNDSPLRISPWIEDGDLISNDWNQFLFDRTDLSSGIYFFSLVSNARLNIPQYFSIYRGGSYSGKFLKIENGTGIYREDTSLAIKIDGVWSVIPSFSNIYETGAYVATSIRDEES